MCEVCWEQDDPRKNSAYMFLWRDVRETTKPGDLIESHEALDPIHGELRVPLWAWVIRLYIVWHRLRQRLT